MKGFEFNTDFNCTFVNLADFYYAKKDILLSGWAMGEEKNIGGKIAMAEVAIGEGSVVLVGFRPQFRAQPRNTFKLLFNSLY